MEQLAGELPEWAVLDALGLGAATSNDPTGLDGALLERFELLSFSSGPTFAEACQERLQAIWEVEVGDAIPFPIDILGGWNGHRFSMRRALKSLRAALESYNSLHAVGVGG